MKRLTLLIAALITGLLLITLTPSAMAQEANDAPPVATVETAPFDIVTPPSQAATAPDQTLTYVAYGVIVIVLILALLNQQRIIGLVAKMVTPETARELVQMGISVGGEAALNNLALKTEGKTDDELVIKPLQAAGYKVTTLVDGTYHVEPPARAAAPAVAEGAGAQGVKPEPFRTPHWED